MEGVFLPSHFTWMVYVKHYESGLVLTSNWRKIDQKFWRNLGHSSSVVFEETFLKNPGGNMFFISTSFYLTVTVLSLMYTKLVYLVWIMWDIKILMWCEICYIHPTEGSLALLDVEIHQHTHYISFLDWLCSQKESSSEFRIEDNKNVFLALRSLHSDDEEAFVYPKMSASSIASAIVLWRLYYELRLASLTYIYCWGRHHAGASEKTVILLYVCVCKVWNLLTTMRYHSPGGCCGMWKNLSSAKLIVSTECVC